MKYIRRKTEKRQSLQWRDRHPMRKIETYIDDDNIYYYDTSKNCKVALPKNEMKAIINAESLNFTSERHCDLIYIGLKRDTIDEKIVETTEVFLIELKDTSERTKPSDVVNESVMFKKAEGSISLLREKLNSSYPDICPPRRNLEVSFIYIVGEKTMESVGEALALLSRKRFDFRKFCQLGYKAARIKACGSDVYHYDHVTFELIN